MPAETTTVATVTAGPTVEGGAGAGAGVEGTAGQEARSAVKGGCAIIMPLVLVRTVEEPSSLT